MTKNSGELSQTTLLETVGAVSSKFGHDFNNLLAAIQGCTELMRMKLDALPGGNPCARQLQLIEASIAKGVTLTDQMRGWVRTGELHLAPASLAHLANSVATFLSSAKLGKASMEVVVRTDSTCQVSEFHVRQALIAIATNAIEAMEAQTERTLILLVDRSDQGASISVIDHGRGFDLEKAPTLFDSKHVLAKKGAGHLGISLAMVEALMQKMGGELVIRSVPDIGTVVTLSFRERGP